MVAMAAAVRSVVLGTAGHIDHGKTSLVQALTGQNTDRLPEEKRRGITIDLGFAPWKLAKGLEASIVDVPGHEAFVRTMVAGAGGLDAVILVISAEDGVMPQTREHLAVCRLLDIRSGLVALTKTDCLEDDADAIELAIDDVRESLVDTPFEDAPILPCSAHTGAGIDALRAAIVSMARKSSRPAHKCPPLLPVDRVFTMKGHGTVVTGTLLEGEINIERDDQLRLVTVGRRRPPTTVRARGMQVRNAATHRSVAGTRTSINLGGVQLDDVARGDVLTRGARVEHASVLHARVEQLEHAQRPWKSGTTLQLCAGTAHTVATMDPLTAQNPDASARDDGLIPPGGCGLVRLRLEDPIPIWAGQRIILRAFSDPSAARHGLTLGGGKVIDPRPSSGRGQRARWLRVSAALAGSQLTEKLVALIDDAGARGVDLETMIIRTGERDLGPALQQLTAAKGPAVEVGSGHYLAREQLYALSASVLSAVDEHHARHPLQPGLGRAHVMGHLPVWTDPLVAQYVIDDAVAKGQLNVADARGSLARPGKGTLSADDLPDAMQRVLEVYQTEDKTTPTLKDVQSACGMDSKEVLEIVSLLHRSELLVRITDELSYAPRVHTQLVEAAKAHLRAKGSIDVQGLKEITGLSRKFVVPLLEHLDRLHITVRKGDTRFPGHACGQS